MPIERSGAGAIGEPDADRVGWHPPVAANPTTWPRSRYDRRVCPRRAEFTFRNPGPARSPRLAVRATVRSALTSAR